MNETRILFIDDEENILRAVKRLLRKDHYRVTITTSPDEVFREVVENEYAVVVSDQKMPEMKGALVLEKVRGLSPDTVRIILTGYSDMASTIDSINKGAVFRFLTKPWEEDVLRGTIKEAVDQYMLVKENERLTALTQRQNEELKAWNQTLEEKVEARTREVSRLNEELATSFMGSIDILGRIAEMHSSTMGNHSRRVAAVCRSIAQAMELDEKEVARIKIAGALHDIGKIGMSPEILSKPEPSLKKEELETLRSHVIRGESIVQMVPHLGDAALYVRHHHEYFNGRGFPDRIRGDEIPLGARIISVADAYDKALYSKKNMDSATPQTALETIRAQQGKKLDPDLVDVLKTCISSEDEEWDAENEVEILVKDLAPGLVLSRDLKTARGVMLLPKDKEIEEKQLGRILRYQESDSIIGGIFVYRRKPTNEEDASLSRNQPRPAQVERVP